MLPGRTEEKSHKLNRLEWTTVPEDRFLLAADDRNGAEADELRLAESKALVACPLAAGASMGLMAFSGPSRLC